MISLQLEENVENFIKTIILKFPKTERQILYLRAIFIDSTKLILEKALKLHKKYQKAKQKIRINSEFNQLSSLDKGSHFLNLVSRQKMTSPSKCKERKQVCDYQVCLMGLVLGQAKSIKAQFESILKECPATQNLIHSNKLIKLYNAFRQFYRSFKRKHKQYVESYSYNEKQIHKNSTIMKQRLLEQLKFQTERRKQLQIKLQVLQQSMEMEKSLVQKDTNLYTMHLKQRQSMQQKDKRNKRFENRNCEQSNQTLANRKFYRSQQLRMSFGNQINQLQIRMLPSQESVSSNQNHLQVRIKQMQHQIIQLTQQLAKTREQMQKYREEKIKMQSKLSESDKQYKKLQEEVNELYSLMNKQNFRSASKNNIPLRQKQNQGDKNEQNQIKNVRQNKNPFSTFERLASPSQNIHQSRKIVDFEKLKDKDNEESNINRNKSHIKCQSRGEEISFLSIRSKSISNINPRKPQKNLSVISLAGKTLQSQMRAEFYEIQEYYENRIREKDQEIQMVKDTIHMNQNDKNQLMLILLMQSLSLEQVLPVNNEPQKDNQAKDNFRDEYLL